MQGKHEALISYATFQAIQDRLHAKAKVPARKDLNQDFPLRGFVTCGCCGTALTACWSTGSHARYAYYLCPKKGCAVYGKSVRREAVEGEFEELLSAMRPAASLLKFADACFRDLWNARLAASKNGARSIETELRKIDNDIDQLMDRIVATDNAALISAYERRVRNLEESRIAMREKRDDCCRPLADYDTTFRTAMAFLSNPCNLWKSPRLEDKRAVLKLAFAERLAYVRGEGFRTPATSSPFRLLSALDGGEEVMVRPTGFEPMAPRLGTRIWRSKTIREGPKIRRVPPILLHIVPLLFDSICTLLLPKVTLAGHRLVQENPRARQAHRRQATRVERA
ncbi:MAG: zinc ribbon domain-containing protein [Methyloceanibacter sp.]